MCNLRSPESSESLLLRLCTGQTPGSFQRQFICTLKSFLSRMRPDVLFMVVNHEFHLKTYLFLAVSDLSCSMQNLHCRKGTYLPMARGLLAPRRGIEPMFFALEGRFLTTRPLGEAYEFRPE